MANCTFFKILARTNKNWIGRRMKLGLNLKPYYAFKPNIYPKFKTRDAIRDSWVTGEWAPEGGKEGEGDDDDDDSDDDNDDDSDEEEGGKEEAMEVNEPAAAGWQQNKSFE
jgi:hypothetical protein